MAIMESIEHESLNGGAAEVHLSAKTKGPVIPLVLEVRNYGSPRNSFSLFLTGRLPKLFGFAFSKPS